MNLLTRGSKFTFLISSSENLTKFEPQYIVHTLKHGVYTEGNKVKDSIFTLHYCSRLEIQQITEELDGHNQPLTVQIYKLTQWLEIVQHV